MSYEITGIVHAIHDTQTFTSGFSKREFVIETTDEKYPQQIKLEAVKDNCQRLDLYQEGDSITVSFNLRGNEYQGKHYVSLQAWKFDRGQSGATSKRSESTPPKQLAQAAAPPADSWDEEDQDIPF